MNMNKRATIVLLSISIAGAWGLVLAIRGLNGRVEALRTELQEVRQGLLDRTSDTAKLQEKTIRDLQATYKEFSSALQENFSASIQRMERQDGAQLAAMQVALDGFDARVKEWEKRQKATQP
jgi:hypothetical protein